MVKSKIDSGGEATARAMGEPAKRLVRETMRLQLGFGAGAAEQGAGGECG